MIEEIWDLICDGFFYVVKFEWVPDLWEFIQTMFENIKEFSVIGLVLGIIGAGFVFVLRNKMLNPFLVHMSPGMAIFWSVATYIGTFIAGYLVGKHFENT